jgi:hypothetical protein
VATYLQAAVLALLPSLVWGWLFVSRNPESKRLVIVTFLMGTLAVVPLLLFMAGLGVQLQGHEAAAATFRHEAGSGQFTGVLLLLGSIVLLLAGMLLLFRIAARHTSGHGLRLLVLLAVAGLVVAGTLSYEQLHRLVGPTGARLADLLVLALVFALVLAALERLSRRTALNVAAAALAALFFVVVIDAGGRLASGEPAGLSTISTLFSLPLLFEVVDHGPLAWKVLEFLQVYLTFAVIAVATLLVVALVHIIYLLHEHLWIKLLHALSLAFFSAPFLFWAVSKVNPGAEWIGALPGVPAPARAAWYANLVLLAGLSAWSIIQFLREAEADQASLFSGLYEEPLNFLGVGLFLTLFLAVAHWIGLPALAFSLVFLAFAEEYSKHLVVRFTDDDSIRSIDDAIEFSVIVGLAFAFAENVLWYFPKLLAEQDTGMLVLRSVLTVLMHAVASGIFGYFYGLAHFASHEVRRGHGGRGPLYRVLHRTFLFSREGLYHEAKLFEGLVLAGSYHAVYNLAASAGRIGLMVVLVGAGAAFLYYLLGLKSNRERLGEISGERVHATYVDRLTRDGPARGS